jgi:3-hydroxybutyryl-CoA dehydrogenase
MVVEPSDEDTGLIDFINEVDGSGGDFLKMPAGGSRMPASVETVETLKRVLLRLGKKPVVMNKFIPGYIVNRLQRAMAREIFHLMDKGYASPEDIDTAVKSSLGIRIPVVGVVQRYDFTGLDLALTFEKNPSIQLVSKDVFPKTLSPLVKKGHLGVKTGRGFYTY